ncbi:hypothetical protein EPH_0002690 [Eimeria praecox]|uniref:Uncharacterized protein n=1 Tax=Eimeria praecox TaxID=51316 RepID=U6H7P6_9EIME|nr:hypothetical protein EPH_0002690 [Eimeria praecox]
MARLQRDLSCGRDQGRVPSPATNVRAEEIPHGTAPLLKSNSGDQTAGAQSEVESTRDEVKETRQVEKMIHEGRSVMGEASGSDEAPQKTRGQPDLEPTGEEKQQAEHEPCEEAEKPRLAD